MNGDGLGGQFNSLGADVDGKYEIFDECAGMLQISSNLNLILV